MSESEYNFAPGGGTNMSPIHDVFSQAKLGTGWVGAGWGAAVCCGSEVWFSSDVFFLSSRPTCVVGWKLQTIANLSKDTVRRTWAPSNATIDIAVVLDIVNGIIVSSAKFWDRTYLCSKSTEVMFKVDHQTPLDQFSFSDSRWVEWNFVPLCR